MNIQKGIIMGPLKVVVLVMILMIVSAEGYPSHIKTNEHYLRSPQPNAIGTRSNYLFLNSLGLQPSIISTKVHPASLPESPRNHPPSRIPANHEPSPVEELLTGQTAEPVWTTNMIGEDNEARLRDRRAVIWRAPGIRIPSITRLFRPQAVPAPRPSGGSTSASLPKGGSKGGPLPPPVASKVVPKGGSEPGPFGAGSPPEDKKSRRKGGSKFEFPEVGDIPSPEGWSIPDFSKPDSPAENPESTSINSKDEGSKTTTEKSTHKWDDHHFHHGDHFHDYDHYGWHGHGW